MTRPNLLLFIPDEWRGDVLGHVGNPAAVTPNLDRLVAEDAVSFANAFCQHPICCPSRASFMTGWYPHTRGHRNMFYLLQPDEPMLLKTLKEAGYYVWWAGKNDVVAAQHGFDAYCDVRFTPAELVAPALPERLHERQGDLGSSSYYSTYYGRIDLGEGESHYHDLDWACVEGAVEQIHNAPGDRPWCLYINLRLPHPPYGVEEPWFSLIDRDKLPPRAPQPEGWRGKPSMNREMARIRAMDDWSEAQWRELQATYYGMCARVDHQFGRVLETLKETRQYDDTAVFFFSDHGDFVGDYDMVSKNWNTFEDCLTRVPLIVKPPASTPAVNRVSDALVELVDLPATIAEVAGVNLNHTHFGSSLMSLVTRPNDTHRDAVFCEGGASRQEYPQVALASANNVPESQAYPRFSILQRGGPEHERAVMCRTHDFKYVYRLEEEDELYDLRNDPQEVDNCISDPRLSDILSEMKMRVLEWFVRSSDIIMDKHDQR